MKRYASHRILFAALISVFIGGGNAAAQDPGQAEQFYGTPAGWTVDADGAIASTSISSVNANGSVLFSCSERLLGFDVSLSAREADQRATAHDGLLNVYPALAQPGAPLLARFTVRFHGPNTFSSARFRYPEADRPARFLQLIRDYPTGLRLHAVQLRQDRLTIPRRIDLYLPGISGENGMPMEIALAVVEERCRRPE